MFLVFSGNLSAQYFNVNGSASNTGGGCYELTPSLSNQTGSIWSPQLVSLNNSFVVSGRMNFGTSNFFFPGADGMAFALQPATNTSTGTGAGMGVGYITPSLVAEFDTYKNGYDPNFDHLAITQNGDPDHGTGNTLAAPVQIKAGQNNVQDNSWYDYRIIWDAPTQTLSVEIDCELRISWSGNVINGIFGGNPNVYWGFSAATGNRYTRHQVCIDATDLFKIDDVSICQGGEATINLPTEGTNYSLASWTPTAGIVDPNPPSPKFSPSQTTEYIVAYQDNCGNTSRDTFVVAVDTPQVNLGNDTSICGAFNLMLDAQNTGSTYTWSTGANTQSINATSTGLYWVEVTTPSGCVGRDSILISANGAVAVNLGNDTSVCGNFNLLLDAGAGSSYLWNDASTNQTLAATAPGQYWVEVTDANGCTGRDTLNISAGGNLPVNLGNDTSICGTFNLILDASNPGANFLWDDLSTNQTRAVSSTGTFFVEVTENGCTGRDTIRVSASSGPLVDLGSDFSLCNGKDTTITAATAAGNVLWNTGNSTLTQTVSGGIQYTIAAWDLPGCVGRDTLLVNPDCCPVDLIADDTLAVCTGYSINIGASDSVNLSWTGTDAFTLVNDSTINAAPASDAIYYVTQRSRGKNLIVNGDFESGAFGFSSQYTEDCTPNPYMMQGGYCVDNNPLNHNQYWVGCGDHTSGNGNMMIVDGSTVAGVEVWCQTVLTTPNTDYEFSAWISTVMSVNPAALQFSINSNLLGNTFNADLTSCNWQNFAEQWNSGVNTSARICLVGQTTNGGGNDFAIDDIEFTPVCEEKDSVVVLVTNNLLIDLGNDTSTCETASITLDAGNIPDASYLWNDGSTAQTLNVNTSGSYHVTVTLPTGCQGRDTIVVNFLTPPTVNLGNDTSLCAGLTLTLDSRNSAASHLWSTGGTNQTLNINQAGLYWVQISDGSCTARDSINVIENNFTVDLGPDTAFCGAINFNIDGGLADNYLWNDGSSSQQLAVSAAGTYHVTADSGGCVATDTIRVTARNAQNINLGPDSTFCGPIAMVLDASVAGSTYLWNDGSNNATLNINSAGTYHVAVTDPNGCTSRDTLEVSQGAIPTVNLGPDSTFCGAVNYVLDAQNPGSTYEWADGSTGRTNNAAVGDNWVIVTSSDGCMNSDTVTIGQANQLDVNLGNDTAICEGTFITLDAQNKGMLYTWSTGENTQQIDVDQSKTGTISVLVSNGAGCQGRDTIDISLVSAPIITLPADTTLCENQPLVLGTGNNSDTHAWTTGESTSTIVVDVPQALGVTVTNSNNCSSSAFINVVFEAISVQLPDNYFHCDGNPTTLTPIVTGANLNYFWDGNPSSLTLSTDLEGKHVFTATSQHCTAKDSTILNTISIPSLELLGDTAACQGDSITLMATTNAELLWNTGEMSSLIAVQDSGWYKVKAFNESNGLRCETEDSILVNFYPIPDLDSGSTYKHCFNLENTLVIQANTKGTFYDWGRSISSGSANAAVFEEGKYSVKIFEYFECPVEEEITVQEICPLSIYIPSGFSPNGDGINDEFKVEGLNITNFTLRIFNRWGQQVFESNDINKGWNGTSSGQPVGIDVYIYQIDVEGYNNELLRRDFQKTGTITLVR